MEWIHLWSGGQGCITRYQTQMTCLGGSTMSLCRSLCFQGRAVGYLSVCILQGCFQKASVKSTPSPYLPASFHAQPTPSPSANSSATRQPSWLSAKAQRPPSGFPSVFPGAKLVSTKPSFQSPTASRKSCHHQCPSPPGSSWLRTHCWRNRELHST